MSCQERRQLLDLVFTTNNSIILSVFYEHSSSFNTLTQSSECSWLGATARCHMSRNYVEPEERQQKGGQSTE